MATDTLRKGNGSVKTITWTNCTTTGKAPDTDVNVCLKYASSCTVQVDSTATAHTSANWDINVYSSPDGTNWDTTTRWDGADAFGDNKVESFVVTMGPAWVRFRLDANADRADVTARVYIK